MSLDFEIDLGELRKWIVTDDLTFAPYHEMLACHVIFNDQQAAHKTDLLVIEQDHSFRIGEVVVTGNDPEDGLDFQEMRHTSLLCQQFKIPYGIPKNASFFGPLNEINANRIMHLVQAIMLHDDEMRDYQRTVLGYSFGESANAATKPARSSTGTNVLQFTAFRPRAMGS